MKTAKKSILLSGILFAFILLFTACSSGAVVKNSQGVEQGKAYSTPEEVGAYLNDYGELPVNFIRKNEAMKKGWDNKKGNLWEVTEKMSIGGDKFGNREKIVPDKSGRQWYECDVNYQGGYRGAERILYSNDGLIFYSDDHYKSATQLY